VATGSVELMVADLNHPVGFVHTVPGPGHKWTALVYICSSTIKLSESQSFDHEF